MRRQVLPFTVVALIGLCLGSISQPPAYMQAFESTVGVVIALKISAFGLLGVYRGAWRYTGLEDLYRILGAILLSSAALFAYVRLMVPVLAASNIPYIDLLLTAAFVLTSRLSSDLWKWLAVCCTVKENGS